MKLSRTATWYLSTIGEVAELAPSHTRSSALGALSNGDKNKDSKPNQPPTPMEQLELMTSLRPAACFFGLEVRCTGVMAGLLSWSIRTGEWKKNGGDGRKRARRLAMFPGPDSRTG